MDSQDDMSDVATDLLQNQPQQVLQEAQAPSEGNLSTTTGTSGSRLIQTPNILPRILTYLLVHNEPLVLPRPGDDWRPYHRFEPAVLRVCRSFYEEGYQLLYNENTLTLCMTMDHCIADFILEHPIDTDQYDPQRLKRFRKIKFELYFDDHFSSAEEDLDLELSPFRTALRRLVRVLRESRALRELELSLSPFHEYPNSESNYPETWDTIFAPFLLLRNLDNVTFTGGLVPRNIAAITRLITTNSPVVDLTKLFEALAFPFRSSLAAFHSRYVQGTLLEARVAVDYHKPADFFKARSRIVEHVKRAMEALLQPVG